MFLLLISGGVEIGEEKGRERGGWGVERREEREGIIKKKKKKKLGGGVNCDFFII